VQVQARLFGAREPSVDEGALRCARRIELPVSGAPPGTAWLEHAPGLVRGDDVLFDQLERDLRWSATERVMYERMVDVPRLLASVPEDGPVHPVLQRVSDLLTERYGRPVDRISLALYRDGRDSVAMHGDHMGEQLSDCIVGIVSLRGPRRLNVRPKGGGRRLSFDLGHGDLLVMGGSSQRDYEHGVPKVASAEPRISVMFRSSA
jgi:alkylated DNA repair dioxygenase AlkB